jgi:hypothetical protein
LESATPKRTDQIVKKKKRGKISCEPGHTQLATQRPRPGKKSQLPTYLKTTNKSETVCADELQKLCGQLGEKIFRLLIELLGQLEKNISTTSSTTFASTTACHARGLVVAHSRKLSATLRGSTSTRPGVQKITIKTCDFVGTDNTTIPTALGGSTTTLPPIVIVIRRQQLDCVIVNYAAPTTIKAKFSSSKNRLSFTFAASNTRGLRYEKSSCISLTSKYCESPSSWRSLSNT